MNKMTTCIFLISSALKSEVRQIQLHFKLLNEKIKVISINTAFEDNPCNFPDFKSKEIHEIKQDNRLLIKVDSYMGITTFYQFDDQSQEDLDYLKECLLSEDIHSICWCYISYFDFDMIRKHWLETVAKPKSGICSCSCATAK